MAAPWIERLEGVDRRAVFLGVEYPISDADRNGIRVGDEELIAANVRETNRPITLLFRGRRAWFDITIRVGGFSAAEEIPYGQNAERNARTSVGVQAQ